MLQAWPQNFSWGPKYQNWSHKYWVDFGKWLVGIYKEWMNGRIKPGINCREVIFQTLKCWIHRSRRPHSSFLWNDVVLFSVNNGVEVTLIILKWWKVLLRLFQYLVSLCTVAEILRGQNLYFAYNFASILYKKLRNVSFES